MRTCEGDAKRALISSGRTISDGDEEPFGIGVNCIMTFLLKRYRRCSYSDLAVLVLADSKFSTPPILATINIPGDSSLSVKIFL